MQTTIEKLTAKAKELNVSIEGMTIEGAKIELTIAEISVKPINERTKVEQQRLTNAYFKRMHKSINWVYAQMREAYHTDKSSVLLPEIIKEIKQSAGSKFPSKKAFIEAHKKGASFYYAIGTLLDLNPNYQRAQKVKRQNKAQSKKA